MKFTIDYKTKVNARMAKVTQGWVNDYAIEVEDYTLPPLLDIVRYLTEFAETCCAGPSHYILLQRNTIFY